MHTSNGPRSPGRCSTSEGAISTVARLEEVKVGQDSADVCSSVFVLLALDHDVAKDAEFACCGLAWCRIIGTSRYMGLTAIPCWTDCADCCIIGEVEENFHPNCYGVLRTCSFGPELLEEEDRTHWSTGDDALCIRSTWIVMSCQSSHRLPGEGGG